LQRGVHELETVRGVEIVSGPMQSFQVPALRHEERGAVTHGDLFILRVVRGCLLSRARPVHPQF